MSDQEKIQLTPVALAHIQKMRLKSQLAEGVFRLSTKPAGCSGFGYHVAIEEKASAGDYQFEQSNGMIVCVDKESYPLLKGTIIDYVRKGMKEEFAFLNPNQKGVCGCGESFSV